MLNLLSSPARSTAAQVGDSPIVSGDSPLTEGGSDAGSEPSGSASGRLFSNVLAAAFGRSAAVPLGEAMGKGLPVPALQEQELGAGIRLITPADSESLREDSLFAFAVGQGLDAALVASVLWPADIKQAPGLAGSKEAEGVTASDPTAAVAALLAGVATGEVSPAVGARAGASLIMAMQGDTAVGGSAVSTTDSSGNRSADAAKIVLGQLGELGQQLPGGAPWQKANEMLLGERPAAALQALVPGGADTDAAAALQAGQSASNKVGTSVGDSWLSAVQPGIRPPSGAAVGRLASGDQSGFFRAALSEGLGVKSDSSMLASGAGSSSLQQPFSARFSLIEPQQVGITQGSTAMGDASLSRSLAATPAQWVLGNAGLLAGVDRLVSSRLEGSAAGSRADAADLVAGTSDDSSLEGMLGGHHKVSAATSHDDTGGDVLDLSRDTRGVDKRGDEDTELSRMARKLSEGLAQRMAAGLANEQWRMRLDLKPAHLGHISVEMTMSQGQLEAVFDAANPAARALIVEGLDKLRQDLQKSGMNVANLWMSAGSGGQHGGKPTAQRRSDTEPRSASDGVDQVQALSGAGARKTNDGFDVLV